MATLAAPSASIRSGTSTLSTPAAIDGSATSQIPSCTACMRTAATTRPISAASPGGADSRAAGTQSAIAASATPQKTGSGPMWSAAVPSTGPTSVPAIAAASGVPITSPRRSRDDPREPGGPGARARKPLREARRVEDPHVLRECEHQARPREAGEPGEGGRLDAPPPGEPAGRDRADERSGRVRRCQEAGGTLREVEFVDVVGQERRHRRVEGGVDHDHCADEEDQAAHDPPDYQR